MMSNFNPQPNRGIITNVDNLHYQHQAYNEDAFGDDGDFAEQDIDSSIPQMQNKTKFWSIDEDMALISAYMNTTTNSKIGTFQKSSTMWKDILSQYRSTRKDNANINPRNLAQVGSRWRRISIAVSKWVEIFAESQRVRRSGMNDQDVIRNALTLWEHSNKGSKFKFMEHWKLLRSYPKWESYIGGNVPTSNVPCDDLNTPETPNTVSSGKRSRTDDDFINLSSPIGEDVQINLEDTATSFVKRQMGVKRAKNKGKKKVGQQLFSQNSQIERMGIFFQEWIVFEREKIAWEREKIAWEREKIEADRIAHREKIEANRIAHREKMEKIAWEREKMEANKIVHREKMEAQMGADRIAHREKMERMKHEQKLQAWHTFANRGEENLSDAEKKMFYKLSEFLKM